jgi:hypothetical protein
VKKKKGDSEEDKITEVLDIQQNISNEYLDVLNSNYFDIRLSMLA